MAGASASTRGSGKRAGKRASGRKKTWKDLGVQRVPSARELFAQDLRRHLPVYANRRVRKKQSFWCLRTLHSRFRAFSDAHMAMWTARAKKAKEDRKAIIRQRLRALAKKPATPDAAAATPSSCKSVQGATTTWLRLDCSVEPPGEGDVSEVAEENASVDTEVERIQWVDDLGSDIRSLRRLPRNGGSHGVDSYGCCYIFEDEVTGEHFCAKLQMSADDSEGARALRDEPRIMDACNHPNVMRAFAMVLCRGIGWHALIMPKCDCDLWAWLGASSASVASETKDERMAASNASVATERREECMAASSVSVATERSDDRIHRQRSGLLVQLCRGYAHLHGAGFLHLDVKPENVVVQNATGTEDARVCIADFGISRGWRCPGDGATPYAPAASIQCEVYRPWDLHHAANGRVPLRPRLDIWAFGCLVYDVCCKHPRVRGDSRGRARLFSGISMEASYEAVMTSRNFRLSAHLRPLEAALVVRCQDLKDPRRNHMRMEELLSACRGVARV